MRLDYLKRIIDAIAANRELESILGAPIERHVVVLVENGRFKFNQLTPTGEAKRSYTPPEQARAAEIVQTIIKQHYPGSEGLPEVK